MQIFPIVGCLNYIQLKKLYSQLNQTIPPHYVKDKSRYAVGQIQRVH